MYTIIALATTVVLSTIFTGIHYLKKGKTDEPVKFRRLVRTNLFAYVPTLLLALVMMAPGVVEAANGDSVNGLGLLAAALSTGLATVGTGYAVGVVGSSALGAVSEDSSILGKTLIFLGLAEGIAIYGLIISIMILGRL